MQVRAFGSIGAGPRRDAIAPIAGRRPALILALLASRPGQIVSDDVIAEAVWGDRPPASARGAIQNSVSALRDQLEPDRERHSAGRFIVLEQGGYRLATEAIDVDLARFDDLIDRAGDAHREDRDAAMALLDEALDLWCDPPLGDFADEPWAIASTARLRERHATAIESRVGLALDADRADDVVDLLVAAVGTYPYRERLVGQLMLVHYRRGQQERALDMFNELRRRLVDDLGVEPGRELQLLQRAILEHDPSLLVRQQHTAVEVSPAEPIDEDGLPPTRRLVGRSADLARVGELLSSTRCVTVTGPGGAGKSALAVCLARDLQKRFGLRVRYLDLARHQHRTVWRGLAAALRVVEHPLVPLDATICDVLAESPTLLVIETCELAPDDVGRVASRLGVVPGLQLLLTSQVPVGLQAETIHRLGGIDVDAAIELLTRSSGPDSGGDPGVLRRIATRLDRLPLGLELAAARLRSLGPVELLRQLDRDPGLLETGTGRPIRQRSVRAASEWSIGLLNLRDRTVLARLTAFTAPFTLATAEAVFDLADDGIGAVIANLVDRSLLERRGGIRGVPRFRIPDDVRGAISSIDPDACADGSRRLAEYVLELAQAELIGRNEPGAPRDGAAITRTLDEVEAEVMPAIRHFDDAGDARAVLLAGLLGSYFQAHGLVSEGREILTRVADRYADAPAVVVVAAQAQAGFLAWYQGDGREASRLLDDLAPRIGEVPLPGFAETVLGCRAFASGDYGAAADHLDVAARRITGSSRQGLLLEHLAGNANWYAGRLDRALDHYRRQRELADDASDAFNAAQSRRFEAMLLAYRTRVDGRSDPTDLERAWRLAEQSRVEAERTDDPMSTAQSAAALAVLGATVGDVGVACREAAAAVRLSRRQFDVFALRTVLPVSAACALDAGEPEQAAETLGWYLDLLDRSGQGPSMAASDLAEGAISTCREVLGSVEFARSAASGAARSIGELAEHLAVATPVGAAHRTRL